MATPGAFIVKDRLESLEARIDTALDEARLKEFSRGVARDALKELIVDVSREIEDARRTALDDLKVERVDVDSRLNEVQGAFDVAIREHVRELASRVDRLEKLVTLSAVFGLITLIAAIAL